ncbi:helix-turn-helix domain-containing protein [Teredinibacter haidensis]|uniref:helix-turn-helix domain-containing protein n=1 Tax=Teredinibacter haidensis TaxID=2731755 RepID=UPI000948EA02|nr:helix-turn-helix domain-containing protein [Teredinibacter haidensis]
MAQSEQLIATLKRELRRKHITYQKVAQKLELSEASVKRMFASGQFTLERIDTICGLIDWDWIDLVEATKSSEKKLDHLTEDQEIEIAKDLELLMVAVSVINGFSFQDLINHYQLTETQCIQKLAKLDRLNLIELLPGNRIKRKISTNFRWNPRGPIQQYFLDVVVQQFFNTRFAGEEEKLVVMNALLSDTAHQSMQQKMDKLAVEMSQAMQSEADLPIKAKKGNTLVIALRRWRYGPFDARTRAPKNQK